MGFIRSKKMIVDRNELELILKEIRELKQDIAILKEDVASIKRCPTVARELAELRLEK